MPHLTIAVDAMGGDQGLDVVIPAILKVLRRHRDVVFILVGDEQSIRAKLGVQLNKWSDRLRIEHAAEVVGMDEPPAQALRKKKQSSMRLAINLVKSGDAAACVSAGNTGALMATARFVLKTLPGIDRPAIVNPFPTTTGQRAWVLDLGANVDSTPEHLHQFAVMGSVLVSVVGESQSPRVALLNVGEEAIKGNDVIKEASKLLADETEINYIGYIEGDAIFKAAADVIVCDGFVGNVALKTAEGVVEYISSVIKGSIMSSWWTKFFALLASGLFRKIKTKLNPERYNGACFLGLNGVVIKSHGGTTIDGFGFAVDEAIRQARQDVPAMVRDKVASIMGGGEGE